MSFLQKVTLENFTSAVGKKTYNEYSKMTGIERTRLFRLFQGAEMRVNELEIFQSFIQEYSKRECNISDLRRAANREVHLNSFSSDIKNQIERNERMRAYLEFNYDYKKAA